jgi:hypothetical protein
VALLVRNGSPSQLRNTLYHTERRIGTRSVDIVEAYRGIYLILQQVLSSSPITLFSKTFDAEQTLEATNQVLQCLLDAGHFVLAEEMNPTDRAALIRDIMSGTVIESYKERVEKGKEMVYEILAYLKDELEKTKMKYLPRGHEEDVLGLVKVTYRLEDGFFGKSRISKNYAAWRKKRDAAAAKVQLANDGPREVAATKAAPKRIRNVRFNEISQRESVTIVSASDASGLCLAVLEAYPLIIDAIQRNEDKSFDNMYFRIAVSKLDNLGQHHALVRYSRDATKNDEHLMPPKYLEQIKSTMADLLASSASTKQPSMLEHVSSDSQPSTSSSDQSSTARPSGLPSRRAAQKKVNYSEVHIDNDGNDTSLSKSNGGKKRKASAIVSTKQPSKSAIVSTSTKQSSKSAIV